MANAPWLLPSLVLWHIFLLSYTPRAKKGVNHQTSESLLLFCGASLGAAELNRTAVLLPNKKIRKHKLSSEKLENFQMSGDFPVLAVLSP